MDRFTLENMFAMDLTRYQEIAELIVNNASRELAIERGVQDVAATWSNMTLKLIGHSRGSEDRGLILGSVEELYQILEDNTLNLQSMSASQFIGPFLSVVQKWEKALRTIADVVEAWLELQKRWMYLEGIFIGGDIRAQLPDEAKRFDDVDTSFRRIMADCAKRPNVLEVCSVPNRKEELDALIMALERCQKSLSEYLKSKRSAFPRFCFISDDELLSILGGSDAEVIQEHVGKMFDNLASFRLTIDNQERPVANALISSEGEVMDFQNAVIARGSIENWMLLALGEMKVSNRFLTKRAVFDYGKASKPRTDWMLEFQGMMILAANQIWWTAEVENAFRKILAGQKQAMKDYLNQLNKQLDQVVQLMGSKSTLTNNDRKKFDTVLTIDVHTRDIIEGFVRDSIMDAMEFEWESQLRFYWMHDSDNLWINQCTGTFEYGYEYMGLNGRLVVTPLTDRIYLTITQALSMYMGGAPAGCGPFNNTYL